MSYDITDGVSIIKAPGNIHGNGDMHNLGRCESTWWGYYCTRRTYVVNTFCHDPWWYYEGFEDAYRDLYY